MRFPYRLALCSLLLATVSCGQAVDHSFAPENNGQPIATNTTATANPQPQATPTGPTTTPTGPTWQYPSFADWEAATADLPANRKLNGRFPPRNILPLTAAEFDKALEAAFRHFQVSPLTETERWVGVPPQSTTFFDTGRVYFENSGVPFTPFAQKLAVDAGTQLYTHGDFHGDIHSLISYLRELNDNGVLKDFTLTQPNTHFLFLGDYTDRGLYGTEVIYTLLRLKLANPNRVHMARGNHEDFTLTARYGFFAELANKFGRGYDLRKPMRIYDFLPVVIYLSSGGNVIQCNHGGMEPGFNPNGLLDAPRTPAYQLLGSLDQKKYLAQNPNFLNGLSGSRKAQLTSIMGDFVPMTPVDPRPLGFMWNDFSLLSDEPALNYDPGRSWVYGQSTTQHLLQTGSTQTQRLRAVVRAHQHSSLINPMMRRLVACRGVHRHWQANDSAALLNRDPRQLETILESTPKRAFHDGAVFTLNVAPDSVYGTGCNYEFDTYAIITTGEAFTDWSLEVKNITKPKW